MSQDLRKKASQIRNETQTEANTADRVGAWMEQASDEVDAKIVKKDLLDINNLIKDSFLNGRLWGVKTFKTFTDFVKSLDTSSNYAQNDRTAWLANTISSNYFVFTNRAQSGVIIQTVMGDLAIDDKGNIAVSTFSFGTVIQRRLMLLSGSWGPWMYLTKGDIDVISILTNPSTNIRQITPAELNTFYKGFAVLYDARTSGSDYTTYSIVIAGQIDGVDPGTGPIYQANIPTQMRLNAGSDKQTLELRSKTYIIDASGNVRVSDWGEWVPVITGTRQVDYKEFSSIAEFISSLDTFSNYYTHDGVKIWDVKVKESTSTQYNFIVKAIKSRVSGSYMMVVEGTLYINSDGTLSTATSSIYTSVHRLYFSGKWRPWIYLSKGDIDVTSLASKELKKFSNVKKVIYSNASSPKLGATLSLDRQGNAVLTLGDTHLIYDKNGVNYGIVGSSVVLKPTSYQNIFINPVSRTLYSAPVAESEPYWDENTYVWLGWTYLALPGVAGFMRGINYDFPLLTVTEV